MSMNANENIPDEVGGAPAWSFFGWVWRLGLVLAVSAVAGWLMAVKLELGEMPGLVIAASIFGVGVFSMLKLRGSPRELGFTFGLKVLSVTAYKVLNFTLVSWLVQDLGFDDKTALLVIMLWGFFMTLSTIAAGGITDALGLRRTLLIGVTLCVCTRLIMVFCPVKAVALACGLLPLAIGEALCTPVLVAALRKYAAPSQRSVAFSVFYALMNLGFTMGYFLSDGVNELMKSGRAPALFVDLGPYRTLLLASMAMEALMFPLVFLIRPGVEMTSAGLVETDQPRRYENLKFFDKIHATIGDAIRDMGNTFGNLVRSDGFMKLIIFLLMIGLLKVVFNVMDYVLPPFSMRELGEQSKVGRLNSVNGLLILVLAPLVGVWTRKCASYSMVILGGFITAASFVFMALPPAMFQSWADGWLGRGVVGAYLDIAGAVHPYYVMIFLWQIGFSVGEAFYSPRVYEYAASIAPRGQEASYASLSYVPLLIGKLVTGGLFAGLLAKCCPATGPRNSPMMWTIVGLMVLIAPLVLLLLKRFIRVDEGERE